MMSQLEGAPQATQHELLAMLDARQLYGRGCGFVDLSLLASALLSEKTLIWTLDKSFERLATQANRVFSPKLHS